MPTWHDRIAFPPTLLMGFAVVFAALSIWAFGLVGPDWPYLTFGSRSVRLLGGSGGSDGPRRVIPARSNRSKHLAQRTPGPRPT